MLINLAMSIEPSLSMSNIENTCLLINTYISHLLLSSQRQINIRVHDNFKKVLLTYVVIRQLLKTATQIPIKLRHLNIHGVVLKQSNERIALHSWVLVLVHYINACVLRSELNKFFNYFYTSAIPMIVI